jgi:protein TonB
MPENKLPRQTAAEIQASVLSSLPNSDEATGVDAPALPTGTTPELHGGSGNDEAEAIPIFKIEPRYPRKAARSKIEGWVKLEFTITESGTVSNPVVVDSSPRRTFDQSALQSIRKWRFKPRVVDGRPVQRKASQVIEFRLTRG